MNTGIGDAVNLAWKLEAVLRDGAPDSILDTYETERIAFARRLDATTDRVLTYVNRRGTLCYAVRTGIGTAASPAAVIQEEPIQTSAIPHCFTDRHPLPRQRAQRGVGTWDPRRRPVFRWLMEQDNHRMVQVRWTGRCIAMGRLLLNCRTGVPPITFPCMFSSAAGRIGPGTNCLVRPDGYVGWVRERTAIDELNRYAHRWAHRIISMYPELS